MPFILGWNRERIAIRAIYGFLAPTGRFVAGGNDNVGSGYWTNAVSSGQTFYLKENKRLVLSTFEMYEFHGVQEDTGTNPGETFDLDYSMMGSLLRTSSFQLQAGLVGYETAADDGNDRAGDFASNIDGSLCGQLARVRCELDLSEA